MKDKQALQIIWDYMHMGHELRKADVILVLGSTDTRVAERAAQLWLDGYAPVIVFSGSGSIHNHHAFRKKFVGTNEAEVFADVAMKIGVPKDAILIEDKSQNTGQNFEFSIKLMKKHDINPTSVIVIQKPYGERRAFATGKVWMPEVELMVTSPQIEMSKYEDDENASKIWSETMVGDMQRIKEYPAKGFQIEQEIPDEVWSAYEYLVIQGYNKRPMG